MKKGTEEFRQMVRARTALMLAARHKPITDAEYVARYKANCVITEKGCWEWQGSRRTPRGYEEDLSRGYAEGCYRGKNWRLGRLMLTIHKRPLLKWELACHRCDNPPCINPDHLFIGTQEHNKLDEVAKGRSYYIARTHCPQGHPYDAVNTYVTLGLKGRPRRSCKACSRARQRIKDGWPKDLANALPPQPLGYTVNPLHKRNALQKPATPSAHTKP